MREYLWNSFRAFPIWLLTNKTLYENTPRFKNKQTIRHTHVRNRAGILLQFVRQKNTLRCLLILSNKE